MRKVLFYILSLCLAAALTKCARQSSPTGGPQDTIPPVLTESSPRHQQTNFRGREITMQFSEYIQLANPKEQLLITPSIGKDYDIIARKNKVIITLENDLEDSTTYTFNFRDAVQDVTEKNPVRNLKLAISTGNFIDSLSVSGVVYFLKSQKPAEEVLVGIQPHNDTFNIFKHEAVYFTKSDEKGIFKLDNLKPGLYSIFAIGDANKNLIADSRTEAYAFRRDSFLLDGNITNQQLSLLRLDARPLKLTSARPSNTFFNIRANKNLKSYRVTAANSAPVSTSFGTDRTDVKIFNTFPGQDSIAINLSLTDSLDAKIDTLIYAKFTERQVTKEGFSLAVIKSRLLADKGILEATISANKPIVDVNFDSIYFIVDSLNTIRFDTTNFSYDPANGEIKLQKSINRSLYPSKGEEAAANQKQDQAPPKRAKSEKPAPKKKTVQNILQFGTGAFISVETDSSKNFSQSINPQRIEHLGVILAETIPGPDKVIIEILDTGFKPKARAVHVTKYTFDDLEPADYLVRVILDKNGNGVWDPGNYEKKIEPEPIIYYESEKGLREVRIKANFEIGPLLITY